MCLIDHPAVFMFAEGHIYYIYIYIYWVVEKVLTVLLYIQILT